MEYLDFELRIMPGAGREYPVSVLQSPAGETSATMRFPFDTLALQNQLQGVEIAVLRSGGTRRDVAPVEELGVTEFGRQLFEALLTDTVRETFRRSRDRARASGRGLRLRLRIEAPELAALPWEYLYDPAESDYVCLSADTPLIRYLEFDRPPEPLTVRPPLSILGLIASPIDRPTLDVEREKQRVEVATAGLRDAGLLKLTWLRGSTWRDLQRTMRQGQFHIFHFVGHGGFDATRDEGVIALTDDGGRTELLSATQLGRLLADHQSLRMVVLNSCLGAKASATDIFSSTASVLVRRGVSAVVGMQYEISDRAAVEFARSLYEAMADGMPIDAAVTEARKAISMSASNSMEWGTPVLHMRSPDGVLFRIDGMTTSVARASGFYRSTPALKASGPQPAALAPSYPRGLWLRHRRAALVGLAVLGLVLAVGGRLALSDRQRDNLPTVGAAAESGATGLSSDEVYRPTPEAAWLWADAKVRQARLSPLSDPGSWSFALTVNYRKQIDRPLESAVDCAVGRGAARHDTRIEIRFVPGSGKGDYFGRLHANEWGGGTYPVLCKIGERSVFEKAVFLPGSPVSSAASQLFPPTLAPDLPCPPTETGRAAPLQTGDALEYGSRGDRCEGMFDPRSAGSALAIVSLTPVLDPYDPDSVKSLHLTWSASVDSAVHIRARRMRRDRNYGMDVTVPAGTRSFDWPTALLTRLHLGQQDIGVVGWTRRKVGSSWRNVYLPLRVDAATSPAAPKPPVDTMAKYLALKLLSLYRLREVYITFGPADATGQFLDGRLVKHDTPVGSGPYGPDAPIRVLIPKDESGGLYRLAASAELLDGSFIAVDTILVDLASSHIVPHQAGP
jgi:hypothetical protein